MSANQARHGSPMSRTGNLPVQHATHEEVKAMPGLDGHAENQRRLGRSAADQAVIPWLASGLRLPPTSSDVTCAAVASLTIPPPRKAYPGSSSTPATMRGCPRLSPSGCCRARSSPPAPARPPARRPAGRAPPPGFLTGHVVVAECGQQHRTGPFRARPELLEHLPDERRLTA